MAVDLLDAEFADLAGARGKKMMRRQSI